MWSPTLKDLPSTVLIFVPGCFANWERRNKDTLTTLTQTERRMGFGGTGGWVRGWVDGGEGRGGREAWCISCWSLCFVRYVDCFCVFQSRPWGFLTRLWKLQTCGREPYFFLFRFWIELKITVMFFYLRTIIKKNDSFFFAFYLPSCSCQSSWRDTQEHEDDLNNTHDPQAVTLNTNEQLWAHPGPPQAIRYLIHLYTC